MQTYNLIGKTYNRTRSADPRIADRLITLINVKTSGQILDVGAGTGNYSYELAKRGYRVLAVEPSEIMLRQRTRHANLKWCEAFAEAIPIKHALVNGVVCTLATHHFRSLEAFFLEVWRVLLKGGTFAIFTQDPRLISKSCWIRKYFEPFYEKAIETLPSQSEMRELIEKICGITPTIVPFRLPGDLKDGFFYAGWKHPEKYLNEEFRKGISVFASLPQEKTEIMIGQLSEDLSSGLWDRDFGEIRKADEYEGGYYFLVGRK